MEDQLPFILSDLISRYRLGIFTEEDGVELARILHQNPQLKIVWERYSTHGITLSDDDIWDKLNKDSAKKKILDRLKNSADRKSQLYFLRYAGIAAIFLAVIGMVLFFNKPKDEETRIVADQLGHYKNDVLPGSERATLTLSNGKEVDLLPGSQSFVESNGNILQLENGELKYSSNVTDSGTKELFNVVDVPEAGFFRLALPDGTRVWLNSSSQLEYPLNFKKSLREVKLKGEAYFEVAHDKNRPFRVQASNGTIEVLGTAFDLNDYNKDISKVTLVNGSIRVLQVTNKSSQIYPGQQASFEKEKISIATANVEKEISWHQGYFFFDHDPIEDIMSTISRWYGIKVHFKGKMPKKSYGGSIKRTVTLAKALDILKDLTMLDFEIDGKTVTVTNKN
jgi:ferric-dicitrate binding protein FerR (iron transport regulator)